MSKITRYTQAQDEYGRPRVSPNDHGELMRYSDYKRMEDSYNRRYWRGLLFVSFIFTVVVGVGIYMPGERNTPSLVYTQSQFDELQAQHVEILKEKDTVYQIAVAEAKAWKAKYVREASRMGRIQQLTNNLQAQIAKQNMLLNEAQQVEVLNAAAKVTKREVMTLAKEAGFTKVKVIE